MSAMVRCPRTRWRAYGAPQTLQVDFRALLLSEGGKGRKNGIGGKRREGKGNGSASRFFQFSLLATLALVQTCKTDNSIFNLA